MNEPISKPKLLYVVDPPLSVPGGVSVLVQLFIEEFSKDYQIFILSSDSPEFFKTHEIGKLICGHIGWKPCATSPSFKYLKYGKKIASEAFALGINLVHFQTNFYNFGNRFIGTSLPRQFRKKGIPSIWTNHAIVSPLDGYGGFTRSLFEKALLFPLAWLGKYNQLQNTVCEIQVSKFNQRVISRVWFPFRRKFLQIYHSKLDPIRLRESQRKKIILNVGYISFVKRQDLLVKAFLRISARHPDWELHLIGHDTKDGCRKEIEEILKGSKNQDKVHFLGHLSDTNSAMLRCGVYVHSSDVESLGLALQEAMHHECPSVASDIDAHKELLAIPGTGLLFRHGDANDLAVKLNMLLGDADLRLDLGRMAKKSVVGSKMTRTSMFVSHSHLYKKILNI